MMKKLRKPLSFVLSLLITLSVFPLFTIRTEAASATGVYGGIDSSTLVAAIDDMEDDFNLAASEWTSSAGTTECLSEMTAAPYSPYEGSHSLKVSIGQCEAGGKITLKKTVTTLTETSYYRFITAAMYIPKEAKSASVTMKLVGSRGTLTVTKSIDAGKWQTVFFENDEVNRGKVERIEFTVTSESSCDLYILLDTVGGCWGENDMTMAKYLTGSFTPYGCSLEHGKDLTVTLSGEGQYIESDSVIGTSFGDGIGLRVDMINHTSCRSLTLKYKTEGSEEYDKEITLDILDSDREITCLFKIPEEKISSFILFFNGSPVGDIEIMSISASPCFETVSAIGSVSECRIARDLKNISVKGSITASEKATDGKVLLYALMPYEKNEDISYQREPLAEARIKNGEFSFTVPLSGSLDGLYKKYIVAVREGDVLVPVCEPTYINNPEILADERTSLPESKKGIRPLPDNYILDGISQTALDINISELVTAESNGVSHTVGNVTCRFSKEYLDILDAKMKEYEREGVKVRFVLKLERSGKPSLDSLLCHPEASGENPAFNTASREGINILRAVTDLLVNRYGTTDGKTDNLVGIVLGVSVNDGMNNYSLGCKSLSEFAREYSIALRTVYNTALCITSGFDISVPLGGDWCNDTVSSQKGSFDARSTLEAISDCITAGGDINWTLAYDITPEKGSYAYEETTPDLGVGAEKITAANLTVLTDLLAVDSFHFNGASRSILLIGNEERKAESVNESMHLSADYVYTFLRISDRTMKNISGYIPSHEAGYNDVLRYIGTDLLPSKADFVSSLIGSSRFNALLESGSVNERTYSSGKPLDGIPDTVKGECVIFDLSKKNKLIPSLNCLSAESGISYGGRSSWGRVSLGKAEPNALRGVVLTPKNPLNLVEAPYLSFDMRCSSLPENVKNLTVTVVVYSKNNAAVTAASVSVEGESKVVCDLSGAPHLSLCDRIGIYVTGENGEDIGEPMILISSVKAHSESLSGEKLEKAVNAFVGGNDTVSVYEVINLSIVAVCAVLILVIRIVIRKKRTDENTGDNE